MLLVETLVLFLVVFATFYSSMKIFNDLPKSEKMQNFVAVLPSFVGIIAFILMVYLFPSTERHFALLTTNLLPTFMVAVTIVLILRVKSIRNFEA
ncbi:hypothetical protein [Bacillus sp. 2205SS5-2]|uniref:hypothetical protein n=1 Tax=Bacillus sp. 2205SS5-2 TaxID=3109031 RepID=UPI0030068DAC